MADKQVKITFVIEGLDEEISNIKELGTAMENAAKKTASAQDKAAKATKKVADAAEEAKKATEDAAKANEGAVKVVDEAFGGLGTKIKEVGGGIVAMAKQGYAGLMKMAAGSRTLAAGIAATGIGALVVAVGLLVSYWDDIVGLVSGVGSEQKKLLKETEDTATAQQEALAALEGSENSLKLQGKSEKEIRDLKIQQTNETITALEAQLEQQKAVKKAQIETANRNKTILEGILTFISGPIGWILKAYDYIMDTDYSSQLFSPISTLLFDPEEVAQENDEVISETEKTLATLKNKRDGFILQQREADQKAADDRKAKADADAKELADKELRAAQELADLKSAIRDAEANTEAEKRAKELEDLNNHYFALIEKAKQNGIDTQQLEQSQLEALQALKDKFAQEDADRLQKQLDDEKAANEKRLQDAEMVEAGKVAVANQAFDSLIQLAGEQSAIGKGAAVAQATMNTYQGATNALANTPLPPPFPQIAAAATIAAGLVNVKKILATKDPLDRGKGGGAVPSMPRITSVDPTAAFAGRQNAASSEFQFQQNGTMGSTQPIRAYVVATEVSSAQEANKKIDDLASL